MSTEINEWILRCVTLIMDNDQRAYTKITEASKQAVRDLDPYGEFDLETYRLDHQGRRAAYDRVDYVDAVGTAVADLLTEMITGGEALASDDVVRMLLIDVLDLQCQQLRHMIGDHYLPEPDDMDD